MVHLFPQKQLIKVLQSKICNITKVIAMIDGIVTFVVNNDKYGNYLIINDNVQNLYGYLSLSLVSNGSSVEADTLFGYTGILVKQRIMVDILKYIKIVLTLTLLIIFQQILLLFQKQNILNLFKVLIINKQYVKNFWQVVLIKKP